MKPNTTANDTHIQGESARKRWMGVLARAETTYLQEALSSLDTPPEYRFLRPPEVGMTMVRGRAGGKGKQFNLGEMTMTRCSVRTHDGLIGHGYIAGRDKKHAEIAAVFDALLQSPEHTTVLTQDIIDPLERQQRERLLNKAEKTAATKVNFFTMVRGED